MSAPTSGSSGSFSESPVPGYYPDPSIPNYIRYWTGSAWMPGTSRPAPGEGETVGPPSASAPPPVSPAVPAVEESGPMFLDEDPGAPVAEGPASGSAPGWPAPRTGPGLPPISWGAKSQHQHQHGPAPQTAPAPVPRQPQPQPQPRPVPSGPAPWAAQVHDLARRGAGGEAAEQVVPWRPPVADPFAGLQGHDRPGGLVRRLVARVVDSVLLAALTGPVAVPLGLAAYHHARDKVDAAELTGETVRVWLIDGTTGAQLGAVLAVVVVAGLLLEVLPTARWGRTAGKRMVGLRVLDIEGGRPPGFGASLRRWLTHAVSGVLVVGVVGLAWCLFDRPWKQCWHDKAARTFVAAG